ncbi:unnamed protein product [Brassica oleracea]
MNILISWFCCCHEHPFALLTMGKIIKPDIVKLRKSRFEDGYSESS